MAGDRRHDPLLRCTNLAVVPLQLVSCTRFGLSSMMIGPGQGQGQGQQ